MYHESLEIFLKLSVEIPIFEFQDSLLWTEIAQYIYYFEPHSRKSGLYGGNWIMLGPYVARICQVFLASNNIQPLAWPPYSSNLSTIEHLWDQLDGQVRQRQPHPTTQAQLTRALVEEWNNIPIRRINALMNSITRRIRAVAHQILRSKFNFNFEIPLVPSI